MQLGGIWCTTLSWPDRLLLNRRRRNQTHRSQAHILCRVSANVTPRLITVAISSWSSGWCRTRPLVHQVAETRQSRLRLHDRHIPNYHCTNAFNSNTSSDAKSLLKAYDNSPRISTRLHLPEGSRSLSRSSASADYAILPAHCLSSSYASAQISIRPLGTTSARTISFSIFWPE